MQNILKSKVFIGALLAIAAAAIAVVIAVNARNPDGDLQTQLDLGEKYVSELDYENAVIAYEEALKIDPYCLEAYLGLSDAYMALGQSDKALEILEQAKNMLPDEVEIYVYLAQMYASQNQIVLVVSTLEEGIRVTDSDRLREMLSVYQTDEPQLELAENDRTDEPVGEENAEEEQEEEEQDVEASENTAAIIDEPHNRRQNITPVIEIQQDNEEPIVIPLSVPVNNTDSWTETEGSYEGSDNDEYDFDPGNDSNDSSGTVEEPVLPNTGISGNVYGINEVGIEDVTINIYSAQGEVLLTASTDTIGKYVQGLSAGTYTVVLSKEGYVDLSTSISVLPNVLVSCNYIMLTDEESQQSASLRGVVIDATNSQQIEGATIALLQGFDSTSNGNQQIIEGSIHNVTDQNGAFSISDGVNAGYYTVEASRDGYSVYHHNETIRPGDNVLDINMSPVIQTHGEYRIVLTWGAAPRDLDSHLICNGNSNYHVYFGNKNSQDGNASLDWDDTSSYGPETITVKIEENNSYIYAVHNFSNGGAVAGQGAAWNLANSGARVVVYTDNGIIFDGNVPVNEQGTTWEVFRVENGRLIVTNEIGFTHPYDLSDNYAVAALNDLENSAPIEAALTEEEESMPPYVDDSVLPMPAASDIAESVLDEYEASEIEEMEEIGDNEAEVMDTAEENEEADEVAEKENEDSAETLKEENEESAEAAVVECGELAEPEEDIEESEESVVEDERTTDNGEAESEVAAGIEETAMESVENEESPIVLEDAEAEEMPVQ